MKEQLANIRSQALAAIEGAADPAALENLRKSPSAAGIFR